MYDWSRVRQSAAGIKFVDWINFAHGSQFADAVASVVGWYYGGDIGLDIF